jgi:organic radical activating enzyme
MNKKPSTERRLTRRGVLWVGLRCDIHCKFCYDEFIENNNKTWISLEEATVALRKFRYFYQNEYIDFMGGEPTLHPKIVEIVRCAVNIGLRPTIITHAMHLASYDRAKQFADAGIHDFLVSIHGIGSTVEEIHGKNINNFAKQMQALDNLSALNIPFRFNCVLIKDNMNQLDDIVDIAAKKGASVINFLTYNPYFEWSKNIEISFQLKHSDIYEHLKKAIIKCNSLGIEANVRYMPICQLPKLEAHAYTGFQLPYDSHEWDYNSWYDLGHPGKPAEDWYIKASNLQQERHNYTHVPACENCAIKSICDGFHTQYVTRWGGDEAKPYNGLSIIDPKHFIKYQTKIEYEDDSIKPPLIDNKLKNNLIGTQFTHKENRAGVKY